MDIDQARKVLTAEVEARMELRLTKAQRFIVWLDSGVTAQRAWQQVALETAKLQRAWEAANIERLLLWLEAGQPAPGDPEP